MGDRFIRQLGEQMLTNATAQAQGGVLGMIFGKAADKRQLKQQGKLQALQIAGNKEMTDYQAAKELQMWKDTNYGAQVDQLKQAGLNPALIYGMGGGGGTTTGGSGGGVTGGQAVHGTEEVQMAGMGMQLGLMQAQKKVLESQANLNNVEAEKKSGVDTQEATARIAEIKQGITNQQALLELTKVETRIKNTEAEIKEKSKEDAIDYIAWQTGKALEELHQASNETFISQATKYHQVDIIKGEMLGIYLRNALTKAQTGETVARTENIRVDTEKKWQEITNLSHEVAQKWRALELSGDSVNNDQRQKSHDQWVNDLQKSTQLPIDIIEKGIQAIFLKELFNPGGKQPIRGFHNR